MELDRPFLSCRLFLTRRYWRAKLSVFARAMAAAPSGLPGNTAVPLVAINGEPRDGFDGQMAATEVLRNSPYLMQVVSSFGRWWPGAV
ncbi:MAG: hypothetical protein CM15mP103_12470 [Gammaproteobacteria bacterium]|nr:MAG: hypothetical protein CM15mP103_12470 [Gammaproteobacteria bacterium]